MKKKLNQERVALFVFPFDPPMKAMCNMWILICVCTSLSFTDVFRLLQKLVHHREGQSVSKDARIPVVIEMSEGCVCAAVFLAQLTIHSMFLFGTEKVSATFFLHHNYYCNLSCYCMCNDSGKSSSWIDHNNSCFQYSMRAIYANILLEMTLKWV